MPKPPKHHNIQSVALFSKKLRGAIVGFGRIAEDIHFPAFSARKDAKIVAIADVSEERRRVLKDRLPGIKIYPDHQEMLAREKLDFIDVAAPPYAHFDAISDAARAGTHVLCEKPIVINREELGSLIALEREGNIIIHPILNYKFSLLARRIKEIAGTGILGTLTGINLNILKPGHRRGTPEWIPEWRRLKKYSGGGTLMDYGPHAISLANFFSDGPIEPRLISTRYFMDKKDVGDVEDTAIIRLAAGKQDIAVNLSWNAAKGIQTISLQGTDGYLTSTNNVLDIFTQNGAFRETFADIHSPEHPNWLTPIIDAFFRRIKNKEDVNAEFQEAVSGMKTIFEIYRR